MDTGSMPTLNAYALIVLVTLLVSWLLDLVAHWLDLRHFSPTVPDEFRGLLDEEKYARAQRYHGARTRLRLVESTFELGVLLLFWWLGGFGWLDDASRAWSERWLGGHPLATGALFVGVLVLAQVVLSLPFRVWSTFVVEERFGFNRTTPATFVADRLKGLALAAVLGLPLLLAVIAFFEYGGRWAWLWAWLLAALFLVAVQYVVPTWILPLFNRFDPLGEGELRDRLLALAERLDFPVSEVYVVDGSRRSSKANAFFTGFGRHKRIALFDTLVEKQSVDELESVLAHEIGHYKKGHIRRGMVISLLHLGLMLFLLSIFLHHRGLFDAFGVAPSTWAGLVFFGLLLAPLEALLALALNALSRRHEYQADRFAAEATAAENLVAALKKLSVDHLANPTPHPLLVAIEYSHPPVLRRIEALRRLA